MLVSKRGYDLDTSPPTEGFSGRCAKLPTNVKVSDRVDVFEMRLWQSRKCCSEYSEQTFGMMNNSRIAMT